MIPVSIPFMSLVQVLKRISTEQRKHESVREGEIMALVGVTLPKEKCCLPAAWEKFCHLQSAFIMSICYNVGTSGKAA